MLKRESRAEPPPATLSESVAGIGAQIDQLVAIIRDPSSTAAARVTACEVVRSYVDFQRLSSITEIWYSVSTLLQFENLAEVRRSCWRLTRSCIARDELNNSTFTAYYTAIVRNSNVEDFDMALGCLDLLTHSGRRVVGSQAPRQLPSVLIGWIQLLAVRTQHLRALGASAAAAARQPDVCAQWGTSTEENFYSVLQYTISLLKFRMAIWEPQEIERLLLVVVAVVRQTSQAADCRLCCQILQTVMAFGLVPAVVLQPVLEVLCGMAGVLSGLRETCEACIVALSRSHLRSSTFVRLCRILDSPSREITLAMRSEACVQLRNLAKSRRHEGSGDGTGLMLGAAGAAGAEGATTTTTTTTTTVATTATTTTTLDTELPTVEVLECYLRTLREVDTPLRLVLTLLDCFTALVDHDLLKRISATTWVAQSPDGEDVCVSPIDMVAEFSRVYFLHLEAETGGAEAAADAVTVGGTSSSNAELLAQYRSKMQHLSAFFADILLDKSININPADLIVLCTRISGFMDTQSCHKVLDAVEFIQLCTPGIPNWFTHLKEIMSRIYLARTDSCRAHVLRIIRNVFRIDVKTDSDWVTPEELMWITNTTFTALGSADSETLSELLYVYQHQLFFSEPFVFTIATAQLAAACISPAANTIIALPSRILDTLMDTLAKAFKLHPRQALVLLNEFKNICLATKSNQDVFARSWAVLSRIRTTRWDQLVIVDHRVEESYGTKLLSLQEPLPKQLVPIHSQPSLVLKGRNAETMAEDWQFLYDTTPIIRVITDALTSEDTSERNFVLVLINTVPILAHYRLLQSVPSGPSSSTSSPPSSSAPQSAANPEDDSGGSTTEEMQIIPLLRSLRDKLSSYVASGGAKFPCKTMTSSRRTACLSVVVHILTVMLPYSDLYTKPDRDRLILTLVQAMNQWNLSTSWATHCFTVACYEASSSLQRYLPQILSRLQLKITSRDSSMYILDFLLSVSQEGTLTNNFNEFDFKRLFGMCFSFIQDTNYQLQFSGRDDIAAKWLLRLAYSSICQLFLSMRLESRRTLVPYLLRSLILVNGNTTNMDQNSLVMYDMITRFTYSDLPLRAHMDTIPRLDPSWEVRRWLWNFTLLEMRCNHLTGEGIKIIRKPAGIFTISLRPTITDYSPVTGSLATPNLDGIPGSGGGGGSNSGDNYTSNFFLLGTQIGLGLLQFAAGPTPNRILRARSRQGENHHHNQVGGDADSRELSASATASTAASTSTSISAAAGGGGATPAGAATSVGSGNAFPPSTGVGASGSASVVSGSGIGALGAASLVGGAPSASGGAGAAGLLQHSAGSASGATGGGGTSAASTPAPGEDIDEGSGGPVLGTSMPLSLPDDAATNRAIAAIDRVPIVDFYKIGIIYCAPGQRLESEILANQSGSDAYQRFLSSIGVLIKLKNNRQYYVGGLDTEQDLDGEFAIAWSSKVSQIIFHTTTMMPSYAGDHSFASKKRHIGNDFVNVYFDESGEDFEFDVVKSQFNFINIVITPTYGHGKERYWKLRVYQKPGMQNTSAAYDLKVVKEESLALFVRNLALKLSLYASIHNDGGEYTDNWVYRLQLITTLKERAMKQAQEQKTAAQQSSKEPNDGDEGSDDAPTSFLAEDDYEEDSRGPEIELVRWADFTQFTN